jgi:hypothetical protein
LKGRCGNAVSAAGCRVSDQVPDEKVSVWSSA